MLNKPIFIVICYIIISACNRTGKSQVSSDTIKTKAAAQSPSYSGSPIEQINAMLRAGETTYKVVDAKGDTVYIGINFKNL